MPRAAAVKAAESERYLIVAGSKRHGALEVVGIGHEPKTQEEILAAINEAEKRRCHGLGITPTCHTLNEFGQMIVLRASLVGPEIVSFWN